MIDGSFKCLTNLPLYLIESLAVTKTIGTKDSNLNNPITLYHGST